MTPDEAPVGTVVVIGHPANGVTATKQSSGDWTYNNGVQRFVDYDTIHKIAEAVYVPGPRCEQRGCPNRATAQLRHDGVATTNLCDGHADRHEREWRAPGWPITRTAL